jgi:hypothetical protein
LVRPLTSRSVSRTVSAGPCCAGRVRFSLMISVSP